LRKSSSELPGSSNYFFYFPFNGLDTGSPCGSRGDFPFPDQGWQLLYLLCREYSNGIDFDQPVRISPSRNKQNGYCEELWIVPPFFLENLEPLLRVLPLDKADGELHDIPEGGSYSIQNGLDIRQCLFCLGFQVSLTGDSPVLIDGILSANIDCRTVPVNSNRV
jgi:hypothetical protein